MSSPLWSTQKLRVVASLVAVLVGGCAIAFAQTGPKGYGRHEPGMGDHLQWVLGNLELSGNQQATVDKLVAAHAMTADGQKFMTAKRNLMERIHAEPMDEQAIRQAAAVLGALEADRAVADAKLLNDVRAVLTPDQRSQLQQTLAKHGPMMEERSR
jgi:Spy/CpxP family protein refolding chaperone